MKTLNKEKIPIKLLILNTPNNIKSSPINPLVKGKLKFDNEKKKKNKQNKGIFWTNPP